MDTCKDNPISHKLNVSDTVAVSRCESELAGTDCVYIIIIIFIY